MKKLMIAWILAVLPTFVLASGGEAKLDKADIDLTDQHSLQRGAKFFMNYCAGCHSLKFMRYNRMAQDLGLTDEQVKQNLMFTEAKMGEPITNALPAAAAKGWFGVVPPDLSVIARARGADWLYTYLRTFYLDESRPFGVNNLVFPDVGMPHVLWQLQGWQVAVKKTEVDAEGKEHTVIEKLESASPGSMSAREYDATVRDLVNFLAYVGEPVQLERQRLGVWVILFLLVFTVVAYLLKKEYWKDIH